MSDEIEGLYVHSTSRGVKAIRAPLSATRRWAASGSRRVSWRGCRSEGAAWAEVLHRGIEGYVAKDPESPYVAGRTLRWLKVKQPKYREEERGFYKP